MKSEPIRVAHIIGKWLGGGVESVVMNYYRHIDKTKVQFDFICDEDSTDIPFEEIDQLGGRVVLIPPYQRVVQYHKCLKKVFRENHYQIVHSHINALSVFPLFAAKCAKVPVRVAHSHSTTNKREWKKNILKQILRPFSKIFANNYFCCSELAGRWLFGNRTYDKGQVYLLKNAIETDKFIYNEQLRKKKRAALNISENTLVIGHIGRFVAQKNHTFLLDVFCEFQKNNKNSLLLLVGQGPLLEEMKEKAAALEITDHIMFLGQREDVHELYQVMDLFLLPSLYEGLGMVLIEAQVAGLPCLASENVPTEVQISNQVTFLPLGYLEEWSRKILKEKENLSTNQRTGISDLKNLICYDINVQVTTLERFYKNMWNRSVSDNEREAKKSKSKRHTRNL